jgi:hypothetical protein
LIGTPPRTAWVAELLQLFTILPDSARTNAAEFFRENERRVPAEDELTVVPGLLGAYPNVLFVVLRKDVSALVSAIGRLDGPASYRELRTRFGLLRS